jgi:hypothetical protein
MKINNRAFGFKLTLQEDLGGEKKGNDCLFLYGLCGTATIRAVKKLERDTGLKAVALLCNGGGHRMYARYWHDEFPKLRLWICPARVPNSANGRFLIGKYPDRWELADNATSKHHVHQLYRYFGQGDDLQVDCVIFNRLMLYPDKTSVGNGMWESPEGDPVKFTNTEFFTKFMPTFKDRSENADDVMFYHRGTRLLITGHHFEFVYIPPGHTVPDALAPEGTSIIL